MNTKGGDNNADNVNELDDKRYETVSSIFYKLTISAANAKGHELDKELLSRFCQHVDCESAGRSVALQVITHKIQSPCETEALIALEILKACVESCDPMFRNEIAKYKFLNELIKTLSPKFLGHRTTDNVKRKISTMIRSWLILMPQNTKIRDTYLVLNSQNLLMFPSEQPNNIMKDVRSQAKRCPSVFTDEKRTKPIAKLLKSSNPADISHANRLIKRLALEEERRMERLGHRSITIEGYRSNATALSDIMRNFDGSNEMLEIAQELNSKLGEHSAALQQMAMQSDEIDDRLGEVLDVNDFILQVTHAFERFSFDHSPASLPVVKDKGVSEVSVQANLSEDDVPHLIDLTCDNGDLSVKDDGNLTLDTLLASLGNCSTDDNTSNATTQPCASCAHSQRKLNTPGSDFQPPYDIHSLLGLPNPVSENADGDTVEFGISGARQSISTIDDLPVPLTVVNDPAGYALDAVPSSKKESNAGIAGERNYADVEVKGLVASANTGLTEHKREDNHSGFTCTNIDDFQPYEGSLKSLNNSGVLVHVHQGSTGPSMPLDCLAVLVTLENRTNHDISDIRIEIQNSNVKVVHRTVNFAGILSAYRPSRPVSSFSQLIVTRLPGWTEPTNEKLKSAVNTSSLMLCVHYKVDSASHSLHTEFPLGSSR